MEERKEIYSTQDIDNFISMYNSTGSSINTIDLVSFCYNPKFINSLYYIEEYNEEYKQKINNISKCFQEYRKRNSYRHNLKGLFRVTLEELVDRLKRIKKADEIINSNASDFMKAFTLASLYKNSESFRSKYSGMVKNVDHPNIQISREALEHFDQIYNQYIEYEKNGLIDKVSYYVNNIIYYQNYEYAKFAVESYIESEESYKPAAFFSELGIDIDSFIFCVQTIEELDPELYNRFIEKRHYNHKVVCFKNAQTIKELAYGIENGFMRNGSEFNILEFIKKVPFKKEKNFVEVLNKFMNNNDLKESRIIIDYIYKNGLNGRFSFLPLDTKRIYENRHFINGVQITNDINDIVIDYLKVNKIPVVNKTYDVAVKMYLNGEINKEMVEARKKEIEENKVVKALLIPKRR